MKTFSKICGKSATTDCQKQQTFFKKQSLCQEY